VSLTLARWSGLAAMLGGVLWDLKAILDADDAVAGPNGATDALFFVVPLLLLVGLAGLYARYAGLVPGLGQTGFIRGFMGLALLVAGFVASFRSRSRDRSRSSRSGSSSSRSAWFSSASPP
jgi:hypothetical protein